MVRSFWLARLCSVPVFRTHCLRPPRRSGLCTCASYCFLNSPAYIELVGGQFQSHGTGVFKETIVKPDHRVMKGLSPIESWDETYVHTKHNTNRVVLAERRDNKGAEPYTWVREHGKGRVLYTAWGQ